jgi:hypothetical protein
MFKAKVVGGPLRGQMYEAPGKRFKHGQDLYLYNGFGNVVMWVPAGWTTEQILEELLKTYGETEK